MVRAPANETSGCDKNISQLGKMLRELLCELEEYQAAAFTEHFKPGYSVHLSNKNCQMNCSGKCQFVITLNDV